MLDVAIVNGLVFIEGGFRKADIGIKDGKFSLIAEPGALPEAARTIDATGKHVLPGGVDTHVHYRDPGHWERETFEVGTRAAAAGGCTTFFEHPISMPPQWNGEILRNRLAICKGEDHPANDRHEKGSCVDFCFFGAAGGEYPEAIVPLADEGIVAYKTFLHAAPEGRDAEFKGLTSANNDELYRVLQEVKKTGLVVAAHAEDNELVTGFIKRLREHNYYDGVDYGKDYTGLANYLIAHWQKEYRGHRYKFCGPYVRPEREQPTEVKRAYSDSKAPPPPKGYILVESRGNAYGYLYYKYVQIPPEDKRKRGEPMQIDWDD